MIKWNQAIESDGTDSFKRTLVKCEQHKENDMGYVHRQEWAERKIKQNHKQKSCPVCGYWFFKCDF